MFVAFMLLHYIFSLLGLFCLNLFMLIFSLSEFTGFHWKGVFLFSVANFLFRPDWPRFLGPSPLSSSNV